LRATRANRDFGTDEKRIRTKITVMDKSNNGLGLFLYKIADCARTVFRPCAIDDPRGRDAVRASLITAARCVVLCRSMPTKRPLRATRANRDFGTDEKRIRTKITVMDKTNNGLGLFLYKIADCARTVFRPCAIDDPRGRLFVRATPAILQQ